MSKSIYKKEYEQLIQQTTDTLAHFEETIKSRIKKEHIKLIDKIVRKDQEKYYNRSHFIRCAIIKLVREEKQRLRI
jgi:hypothetical protein